MSEESGGEPGERGGVGDGVVRFAKKHTEAAALLSQLTHPGGKLGTAATLRTCFLYVNGEGIPDPSVAGLPLEERIDLVGRAIVEGISTGWREWNPRALAGFIRRLRETPPPTLPGGEPRLSAEEEAAREEARREAARARQRSDTNLEAVQRAAEHDWSEQEDAARWLEQQPPETKARATLLLKARLLEKHGYSGEPEFAPKVFVRHAVGEVVKQLRTERSEAAATGVR